jgi:raffinose/stachyose/melibiose transport system permease protein
MKAATATMDNTISNRQTGNTRRFQDKLTIFLFLLPGILLFLTIVVYPILQSIYYSFYNWNGFGQLLIMLLWIITNRS